MTKSGRSNENCVWNVVDGLEHIKVRTYRAEETGLYWTTNRLLRYYIREIFFHRPSYPNYTWYDLTWPNFHMYTLSSRWHTKEKVQIQISNSRMQNQGSDWPWLIKPLCKLHLTWHDLPWLLCCIMIKENKPMNTNKWRQYTDPCLINFHKLHLTWLDLTLTFDSWSPW